MQKLAKFLSQHDIIGAIAERINNKHPDVSGKCEIIAEELANELKKYGVNAKHVIGWFSLDEPSADRYASSLYTSDDDYKVEHDWVDVEGKILDTTAKQFRDDVYIEIPDIVYADHAHPLYLRYEQTSYA
jgi:hypothetical protein